MRKGVNEKRCKKQKCCFFYRKQKNINEELFHLKYLRCNMSQLDNITLITGFLDIGRTQWENSTRTTESYLSAFDEYLRYGYKMIVFLDDRYIHLYVDENGHSKHTNKTFVPINRDWLLTNTQSWSQLKRVQDIMSSTEYRETVKERIMVHHVPENIYPEYNLINHSKIDFIHYAIQHQLFPPDDWVCWSDFGIFDCIFHKNTEEYPTATLDIRKFNTDKINFCLRYDICEQDRDMLHTLQQPRETFTGGFFGGSQELLLKLHVLYHECLEEMYAANISDDDQHVYLRCYVKNPDLFQLHVSENGQWPRGLTLFQKTD